jgi:carboxynorspermidine decarboxylase
MTSFDPAQIITPAFVVDLGLLRKNLEKLAHVQEQSGCRILLALKGFSMFSTFPLVRQYLHGCCASGLHEALLAHEEFRKEVHVYAPAFKPAEMASIIPIAHHLSFNSLSQWRAHRPALDAARAAGRHTPSPGLRVNPEHSEVEVALYDPCSPGCRLGTRADLLEGEDLSGLEGLHFHALCEQNSDVLERTLAAVEKRFPKLLEQVQWVNMGGGHHITRDDYDTDRLIRVIRDFKSRWNKDVYLEPGEAIALNTGYLVTSVMDVVGLAPKASKSSVAISQSITDTPNHEDHSSNTYRGRTPEVNRRAAKALIQRLDHILARMDQADAGERINTETQSLLEWATREEWLISESTLASIAGPVPELEGASEHDVLLDRQAGRVIKITRPPNFGARGAAVDYLTNVVACWELLAFDWRLEGIVGDARGVRIVTSQPLIRGQKATVQEIDDHFISQGFCKVRENTYRNEDGITIADARPDNILRDPDGILMPIDVHILGVTLAQLPGLDDAIEASSPLPTAILDTSATCHMPDTLEMPYRPHVIGSGQPGEKAHTYKLGGMSCLAGDVINEYAFDKPLVPGQRIVFTDMAHYTMVKTTTFNGVPHPDIATYDPTTSEYKVIRRFGYEDFKRKLS